MKSFALCLLCLSLTIASATYAWQSISAVPTPTPVWPQQFHALLKQNRSGRMVDLWCVCMCPCVSVLAYMSVHAWACGVRVCVCACVHAGLWCVCMCTCVHVYMRACVVCGCFGTANKAASRQTPHLPGTPPPLPICQTPHLPNNEPPSSI